MAAKAYRRRPTGLNKEVVTRSYKLSCNIVGYIIFNLITVIPGSCLRISSIDYNFMRLFSDRL